MKRFLLFLSIATASAAASAQMSLNDCLVYAREHAHSNIIKGIEVREASADVGIAASYLMPEVGISTNGNMSFGRNIDPETNTYDNRKTLYSGFALQMSLPLFDGLAGLNNLKAAKTGKLRRAEAAKIEEDNISLEVIRAFYNVSYCKAMVSCMEEQLERDLRNLQAVETGLEIGTKSGADVAEIKAIVASDRYELTNQESLLSKAYLLLKSRMGMEPEGELDLTEEEQPVTSDPGFIHPRIAEAQLGLRESRYNLRAARGAFFPSLSLNAGISTSYYRIYGAEYENRSFSRQWHDNMGQYVGVSLSLPIFTGMSRTGRVKKASLEVKRQEIMLDEARYEIERQKAEAELDYRTASKELTAAAERLEAEKTAYNATQRKFELGGASAIDLYTAGAKLASARANMEGKRIQKIISRIVMGYYNGEKLIN